MLETFYFTLIEPKYNKEAAVKGKQNVQTTLLVTLKIVVVSLY